jgi:hypothetical protein
LATGVRVTGCAGDSSEFVRQFHDINFTCHGGPSSGVRLILIQACPRGALIWIKRRVRMGFSRNTPPLMQISAVRRASLLGCRMATDEHEPGAPAPHSGGYEELNVFGTPTGRIEAVARDDALPTAARGFTWRPLSGYSAAELRARAATYRRMAATATTATVRDSLRKLAERFDTLADRREREEQDQP